MCTFIHFTEITLSTKTLISCICHLFPPPSFSLSNNSPNWNLLYAPHKDGWKSASASSSRVSHEVYIVAATRGGLWLWLQVQAKIDWTCRCCACSIVLCLVFFLFPVLDWAGTKGEVEWKRSDFDGWIMLAEGEPKRETKSAWEQNAGEWLLALCFCSEQRIFLKPEVIRELFVVASGVRFILVLSMLNTLHIYAFNGQDSDQLCSYALQPFCWCVVHFFPHL